MDTISPTMPPITTPATKLSNMARVSTPSMIPGQQHPTTIPIGHNKQAEAISEAVSLSVKIRTRRYDWDANTGNNVWSFIRPYHRSDVSFFLIDGMCCLYILD